VDDAFDGNDTVKVECGGMSTTASGGWSLGFIDGKSCGEEAARWLTTHFAHYPNSRVRACSCLLVPARACSCLLVPARACSCLLVPARACSCLRVRALACLHLRSLAQRKM
jgi:hypothetical protein